MKIDLSKKQVGDMVFTTHGGEIKVVEIHEKYNYPLLTTTRYDYNMEGKYLDSDKHPTCFNSREEFDEYWAQVKE
jgi:hypothetical protein